MIASRCRCLALGAALLFAFGLAGCGATIVALNPQPPAEQIGGSRLPIVVGLYFDDAFQHYHWQGGGKGDFANRDFDLGGASRALFLETFTQLARSVTLVNGKPPDPAVVRSGAALVIWPQVTGFQPKPSAAEITYSVAVYDRQGKAVIAKQYVGRGTTDESKAKDAPAAASERAMTDAMRQLVEDLKKLDLAGLP